MIPSASVSSNTWPWARTRRAAAALSAVAIALFLPATAAVAGQGGIPSPDPSEQFAPDPAPSGGQPATAGGTPAAPPQPSQRHTPPVTSTPPAPQSHPVAPLTRPASDAAVRSAPATHRVRHHHHQAAKPSTAHRPRTAVHHTRALARPFAATLRLAFAPPSRSIDPAGGPDDALGLAALALLLLVVTGLLVVRTSTQLLRRERPA
jgi:hypothetical protein